MGSRQFLYPMKGKSYADKVLGYNPIAYWPLWETSGATAEDLSGNGFHGTYTGVTLNQAGIGDGHGCPYFNGNDYVDIYSVGLDTNPNHNLVRVAGFEFFTGTEDDGASDAFDEWDEASVNDGAGDKVEATATAHSGSYAVKVTRTTASACIQQTILVQAGLTYDLSFWTRGDGSHAGRYGIYDVTHSAYITAWTSTGITGAAYTEVTDTFTVPAGCTLIRLYIVAPVPNGTAYFDDVSITPQTGSGFNTERGSMLAWAKADAGTWTDANYRTIASLRAATVGTTSHTYFWLFQDNEDNEFKARRYLGSSTADCQLTLFSPSAFTCYLWTWDVVSDHAELFVDGVSQKTASGLYAFGGFFNPGRIMIGAERSATYNWLGHIAHVAFFDEVLGTYAKKLATV